MAITLGWLLPSLLLLGVACRPAGALQTVAGGETSFKRGSAFFATSSSLGTDDVTVTAQYKHKDMSINHHSSTKAAEARAMEEGVSRWAAAGRGLTGTTPVPPAMRCVSILIVLYFGAYLALLMLRGCTLLSRQAGGSGGRAGRPPQPSRCEAALQDSIETLAFVPMTCVLMISARLRAIQVTPDGNPQPWAQTCMYLCTWAILFQFALQVLAPACLCNTEPEVDAEREDRNSCTTTALNALRFGAMVLLYTGFSAILYSVFVIEAPEGATPPVSPMMQCVSILTVLYCVVHFGIIVTRYLRRFAVDHSMRRRQSMENQLDQLSATLAFAPMLCLLMIGTRMRAIQLNREPPDWAQNAMFVATWSIVVQTCLVAVTPLFLSEDEAKVPPLGSSAPYELEWGAVLGKGKDEGSSSKAGAMGLTGIRFAAILLMYAAIAVIIVAVFAMEPAPLDALKPSVHKDAVGFELLKKREAEQATPPVSTAMRCVTILSLIYFFLYLCIVLARTYQQFKLAYSSSRSARKGQLESVLEDATKNLVFVPMLCVMMIGLRLRAKQLGVRDPQTWAQTAMYFSTFAILLQIAMTIVVSFMLWDNEDDENEHEDDAAAESRGVRNKAVACACLCIQYLAMACLYGGMGVLVAALFAMEPNPAEAWAINPDVKHLSR